MTPAFSTAYMLRTLVVQSAGNNTERTLVLYRCSGAFAELKRQGYTVPPDVNTFFAELDASNSDSFVQLGQVRTGSSIGGGTTHKEIDDLLATSPEKFDELLSYARLLKANKISEVQLKDFKVRDEKLILQQER